MAKKNLLQFKSLREQVYDHLRQALQRGELVPGASVNPNAICEQLGISKTPLRFALLQLESEGFVTILPRRGCVVKTLTLDEIRSIYQIIGALESSVISSQFHRITPALIEKMKQLNEKARVAIEEDDFSRYYDYNLKFHNCYLRLCTNQQLLNITKIFKNRLYDFPRKKWHIKEWEVASTGEHAGFIRLLEEGSARDAANYIRDVHWSYQVQERYIRRYYTEAVEVLKSAQ